MHFAKSTKSDVSNRKTIQVTGAYAEVLIHLLNVTKKARVAPAYGKVRERCLALEKDRKALVAGCSRGCVSPTMVLCLRLQPVLRLGSYALSLTTPKHFLPASPFSQVSWVHCDFS